ncbi:putative steroid dehydrogenase, partial [Operophtera brumata]
MDKLKATSEELEKEFSVATKIIQVDFCEDKTIYERIQKEISGLEIGTLVNNANVVSVTNMTKLVMPAMVERKKGVVINLGSASSAIPSPLLTQGIIVQCVLPGFVCSNMSGIRRSSLLAPTAKEFVKSSIGLVGTAAWTTGYLPHAAFVNVINAIQATSYNFANWVVTRTMETSRRKVLKKYKKQ